MFAFVPVFAKTICPRCGQIIKKGTTTLSTDLVYYLLLRPETEIELDFYCPRCNYKFNNKINKRDLWK